MSADVIVSTCVYLDLSAIRARSGPPASPEVVIIQLSPACGRGRETLRCSAPREANSEWIATGGR